jgi:hypothetical protein
MDARKIAAAALIVIGALGLGYGGFSHAQDTHPAGVGANRVSVDDKQSINVPVWAGAGAIVLMLVSRRRG